MALNYDFSFYLLCVSTLLLVVLVVLIVRMKDKTQIHGAFLFMLLLLLVWCSGHILEVVSTIQTGAPAMAFVYIYYFGVCFTPLSMVILSIVFVKSNIKFSAKYILLLLPPVVDYLLLLTNSIHHLYFEQYSIFVNETIMGSAIAVHFMITYSYIAFAMLYLFWFSIKDSGFFSRQSVLILIGMIVPVAVNILLSFNVIPLPLFYTPVFFVFAAVCFMMAIFKFDFLSISPIALQHIVNLISDCYIVVDEKYSIVDYNQPCVETFQGIFNLKRKQNLLRLFGSNPEVKIDTNMITKLNEETKKTRTTAVQEVHIQCGKIDKIFSMEITPIFSSDRYIGTIVLLKDVTQSRRDLETIKMNQNILMEQERLASLGQLIGGVAHNLRTPIMSLSGGMEALKDLVKEYKLSIDAPEVLSEDHMQIAGDMESWLNKMQPYCSYMADIISTVKGQATQLNTSTIISFTLDELINRIELLMKHELKRYHCTLNIRPEIATNTVVKGDVNNLVQIFDNLIINSIHAYEGANGEIDFTIAQNEDGSIVFTIRDYARGIDEEIQHKLFKEMITTKGQGGTGLGLYMSYSTIVGKFNGSMRFESSPGAGTTFYITIPYLEKKYESGLEVSG